MSVFFYFFFGKYAVVQKRREKNLTGSRECCSLSVLSQVGGLVVELVGGGEWPTHGRRLFSRGGEECLKNCFTPKNGSRGGDTCWPPRGGVEGGKEGEQTNFLHKKIGIVVEL